MKDIEILGKAARRAQKEMTELYGSMKRVSEAQKKMAVGEEFIIRIGKNAVIERRRIVTAMESQKRLEEELVRLKKASSVESSAQEIRGRMRETAPGDSGSAREMREPGHELVPVGKDGVQEIREPSRELVPVGKGGVQEIREPGRELVPVGKDGVQEIREPGRELVPVGKDGVQEIKELHQEIEINSSSVQEIRTLNQEIEKSEKATEKAKKSYKTLGGAVKSLFGKLKESAGKAFDKLIGSGKGLYQWLSGLLGFDPDILTSALKEGFGNLYQEVEGFKSMVDGLNAEAQVLKNSLAAAFRPLVEMAIPYIQGVIGYLSQLMDKVGQFIAAAAGQKTYTKAVKQTTSALKEQNKVSSRQLSSLDKLNNLSSGGGESGEVEAGDSNMFQETSIDAGVLATLQQMAEYAQRLKEVFAQGFWDGLGDWEYRWESVKSSVSSIKESLTDIWTDPGVLSAAGAWSQSTVYMLGSVTGSLASVGLTLGTNLLGGLDKYLSQNKGRIKEHLISMFSIGEEINGLIAGFSEAFAYIFEAFGSEQGQQLTANLIGIFANAAMGIGEIVSVLFCDIANVFIQPFVDNKEAFREALEGFLEVLASVTGTIKEGIDETFAKLSEVYEEHFQPFFDSLSNGLSDSVGKFAEMWNSYIQPILDVWAEKFDVLWNEHLQPVLNNFLELLGSLADLLAWVWEVALKPLLDWLITVLGPTVGGICDFIFSTVDTVISFIADLINGIVKIVKGVIDILMGIVHGDWQRVWDGFAGVIDGVAGLIIGIVNFILGAVETLANGAVEVINMVIRAINSISIDVPDWIPSGLGGGSTLAFNIPEVPKVSIPRLATGAVIPANKEFLAVLGDQRNGTNLEAPESLIRKIVREEAGDRGGAKEINLTLNVDCEGYRLLQLIQKLDLEQYSRTGRPSFQL